MTDPRRTLYPPIEPFQEGFLDVSPLHSIYYEQSGNPDGKPVIFVHGGPGAGTSPDHRRFFDPAGYQIILFDQRGCGKSKPFAALEDNTTQDLISDMEQIRAHLGIDRWQVFGGSWGSTLGLAYVQTYPNRVTELILRGIFLCRPEEIHWLYQDGASQIFPEAFERYLAPIPFEERGDLVAAYHTQLTSDDELVRVTAARAWSQWEGATCTLLPDPSQVEKFGQEALAVSMARIECHYFSNGGFFDGPDQLLKNCAEIRHIPGIIVQGRYDIVCPPTSAWDLHNAWPEADLQIIPDVGHSAFEPGITDALIRATDKFVAAETL